MTRYNRSETDELANPELYIGDGLQAAASSVGAEPITSTDSLTREMAQNHTLHQAFHQEVRNEVRRNLRNNQDLIPYKYKNTEKYFGNKK